MKKAVVLIVLSVLFLAALPSALADSTGAYGSGSITVSSGPRSAMMINELRQKTEDARHDFLAAQQQWVDARTEQRTALREIALSKTARYLKAEKMHLWERIQNLQSDENHPLDLNCDLNSLPPLPGDLNSDTNHIDVNQLKKFWHDWKEKSRQCLKELKDQRAEWLLAYSQAVLGKSETMLGKIKASGSYSSNDRIKTAADKLSARIDKLQAAISELLAQDPRPENFWGQAHRFANASNMTVRQVHKLALAVWRLENKKNDTAQTGQAHRDIDSVKGEVDSDAEFNEQASHLAVVADAQLQAHIEQSDKTEDVSEVLETSASGGAS